ncbi:hypothetical protein DB30_03461 [Enhygromyxa salina]|uniref:Uncharacterized protein n=1 Tax=Enhygromyxa salina TaxID=215803 RepID=A0A0C2A1N2_9BACT|nr:hypothetical protein DB30_03461 [Enhygromyxa salina]
MELRLELLSVAARVGRAVVVEVGCDRALRFAKRTLMLGASRLTRARCGAVVARSWA